MSQFYGLLGFYVITTTLFCSLMHGLCLHVCHQGVYKLTNMKHLVHDILASDSTESETATESSGESDDTVTPRTEGRLRASLKNSQPVLRKAGGSLPVAYCSLAVACCLLFVSEKWRHNSYILLYFQFPELKLHNQ